MARPDVVDVVDVGDLPVSVLDAIGEHAHRAPDSVALLAPGREPVSYGQLARAVRDCADLLVSLDIRPTDRVAVMAPNDLDGAVLLLTTISAAVCAPLNPAWPKAEIAAYLDAIQPALLIIPGDSSSTVKALAASSGVPYLRVSRDLSRPAGLRLTPPSTGSARPRHVDTEHGGEVLLLRTSGTTATGKVVPLTMTNIVAAAMASVSAYRLTAGDRRLNVMPLFHVQGLVGSLTASLLAGGSVVCVPVFEPAAALGQLAEYQVTWFSASPTMHRLLLDTAPEAFRSPPSLRFVRCGSGALPGSLRRELEDRYRVPVVESYGMSEAHQIASTPLPPDSAAGMVATGARIAVLDEEGVRRTEPGSSGEIVISGANVIDRYLLPADSSAFVDGWLRTGDLGTLAADGSLLITGRLKEIINSGGEKFSPYEVETALLRHPSVRQAVAFAVPDPVLVERCAAAVLLAPAAEIGENELIRFVAGHLAAYKTPRRVLVREEIPIGPSGKIERGKLAAQLADELTERPQAAATTLTPPRTALEATLAGLWALALRREAVGIDEDFLVLGGDSLNAVALLTMLEEVLSVELSPLTVFDEASTVASMAELISSTRAAAPDRMDRV